MTDAGGRDAVDRPAVVIPAFAAAGTLPGVLARLRAAAPDAVPIVVDDGSTDGTASAAERSGARVVRHDANRGKGRALEAGIAEALAGGATAIVTMDADGQHAPEAVPTLLAPIAAGRADLVLGTRRRAGSRMPWPRRVTNGLSSRLVARAAGGAVTDSQTGFRAFTAAVAEAVRPRGARYEYETEFLFLAAEAGFRIAAVPVPTVYDGAPSHFRYGTDTLRLAAVFLRHWRPILGARGTRAP
jgi:glycosyltransferase involved in cell wall biosynthesis